MDRRAFLRLGGSAALFAVGAPLLTSCEPGTVTYGDLLAPDANGLRLPQGFTARIVATSGQVVTGTGHTWHGAPDGGACFPTSGGGWVYVSNCEIAKPGGGVGALRFDATGQVLDAYTIASGTDRNCAGGATSWGTWLTCEEVSRGQVVECDPLGLTAAVAHPAMGLFQHEAACEDPATGSFYMTEDRTDGCFYRFHPTTQGDLSAGALEVLTESAGVLGWATVPDPLANPTSTRLQVAAAKHFTGGEGVWHHGGSIYFTTKGDNRLWRYRIAENTLEITYDDDLSEAKPLTGLDNIGGAANGDLYVAEDGGDMQLCLVDPLGNVGAFFMVTGRDGSELTGPAFSPDGTRLYVSSQRSPGETFEISGPFRA